MTWAGIDYDTFGIHVCLIPEEGAPVYERRELRGADAFERTRSVRDAMPSRGWWTDQGVVAVGIEEPMARGKLAVSLTPKLKAIQGAIVSGLPGNLLVNPMTATDWRTAVGLPGNASKHAVWSFVMHRVVRLVPSYELVWPQDACDAWCLAFAVSRLTEEVAA